MRPVDYTVFEPWHPKGAKPGEYKPGFRGAVYSAPSFDVLKESIKQWYSSSNVQLNEADAAAAGIAQRNAETEGADPQQAALVAGFDSAKKRLWAFAPTVFEGNHRKLENVKRCSFYTADLDGLTVEAWRDLQSRLDSSGLNWFAYGSPKYGIAKPNKGPVSLRLCIETDRDTNADETRRLRRSVAEYLNLERDPTSDEPSRLFFVGTVGEGLQQYFVEGSGKPLPVDWTIEHFRGAPVSTTAVDVEAVSVNPQCLNTFADSIAAQFKDGQKNTTCFAFGGWAKQLGMTEDDAAYVIHRVLSQIPSVVDIDAGVDACRRGYSDYLKQGYHKLADLLGPGFTQVEASAPKLLFSNVDGFEFAHSPELAVPEFDDEDFPEFDDSGPKREYLVPQLELGPGRINMIIGYSGSGKTISTGQIAFDLAMGRKVFDKFEIRKSVKVLIVAYEAPDLVAENLQRIAKAHGVEYSELKQRLKVVEPRDKNGVIISLSDARFIPKLHSMIQRHGYGCVIIDTLRAATPELDENDKEIAAPLYALEPLSKWTQSTFIVLHHENKSEKASLEHKISGHAAIHGTIQCALSISKVEDQADRRLVRQSKAVRRGFQPFEIQIVDTDAKGTPLAEKVPGSDSPLDLNEASPGVRVHAVDSASQEGSAIANSDEIQNKVLEYMKLHGLHGQSLLFSEIRTGAGLSDRAAQSALTELIKRGLASRAPGDQRRYQLAPAGRPRVQSVVASNVAPTVPGFFPQAPAPKETS